jgi:cytochrome c-type biogenesis protein CcmH
MKRFFILFFILSSFSFAAENYYSFSNIEQQKRFEILTSELRCLVCQNQTLAESNASLANDMREKIYRDIKNGKSDKEIIHYLVSRYGNFILYKPPFNLSTAILWVGPFGVFLIMLGYLVYFIKRKKDV